MLLPIAIADAYGAGFEYADPSPGRPNDLSGYVRHPRHGICPGCYTDDTQMSLAVAEALLEPGEPTRERFADAFVRAFRRDPREGYAGGFWTFLKSVRDGGQFLARIRPDSDKSGAAMRSCPLGTLPDARRVLEVAALQARITHDTDGGVASSQAVALATHYGLRGLGPRSGLPAYLDAHVPGGWGRPHAGKVGSNGMDSVRAALTAVMRARGRAELLRSCVAFRGDVDTVAAIAMGIAANLPEIRDDIPDHLVDGLEAGRWGRPYIESLDARLAAVRALAA